MSAPGLSAAGKESGREGVGDFLLRALKRRRDSRRNIEEVGQYGASTFGPSAESIEFDSFLCPKDCTIGDCTNKILVGNRREWTLHPITFPHISLHPCNKM